MNDCPGCGASLRYDITEKALVCDHCRSQYDPYEYDSVHNAPGEEESFPASLLVCPNCGAQIVAAGQSAAEYCSYCGSFVMLSSSQTSARRPDLIIPFGKTKEDCKKIYRQKLRKHLFAPGELKDPDYLNRFSGFYIPYWVYDVGFSRTPHITGTTSRQDGDYIETSVFDLSGDLNAEFKGIAYDASSAFDDNISESIAPYEKEEMKEFTPSFLFGFYANTEDVDRKKYEKSAKELATEAVYEKILEDNQISDYKVENKRGTTAVGAHIKKTRRAMLPVWFLTWRKKDRVAYSVVNGETGRIYAEIPIDIRKYLLFSLALMVPLFLLLEGTFHFTAPSGMLLGCGLTMAATLIFYAQMTAIAARNTGFGDKGAFRSDDDPKPIAPLFGDPNQEGKPFGKIGIIFMAAVFAIVFAAAGLLLENLSESDMMTIYMGILIVLAAVCACLAVMSVRVIRDGGISRRRGIGIVPWLPCAVCLAGAAAAFLRPVEDQWYYGLGIFALVVTGVMLITAISMHNRSVTRPVPDFFSKAKEERA